MIFDVVFLCTISVESEYYTEYSFHWVCCSMWESWNWWLQSLYHFNWNSKFAKLFESHVVAIKLICYLVARLPPCNAISWCWCTVRLEIQRCHQMWSALGVYQYLYTYANLYNSYEFLFVLFLCGFRFVRLCLSYLFYKLDMNYNFSNQIQNNYRFWIFKALSAQ